MLTSPPLQLPRLAGRADAPRPGSPAGPSAASASADRPSAPAAGADQSPQRRLPPQMLRRLGSSASLQELAHQREQKAASPWVSRYQREAKCELVGADIAPLIDRFEDASLYHKPQRKPLSAALQEMTAAASPSLESLAQAHEASTSASPLLKPQQTPKRQGTELIYRRRAAARTEAGAKSSPTSRVIPSRFLFDGARWARSTRCDYCSLAGGDLECATCDVIAHARCYLRAYQLVERKTKGAFVTPTRFSWLCAHCQQSLQNEYDERAKHARMQHIAQQRHVFGQVVTAYVRMTKDAMVFQAKKRAIVKIQAAARGRLARLRFDRLRRAVLKPYAIDGIRVCGFSVDLLDDDLRLANGFACNPYVYVSVVDGKDDENQLFCFETSVRKGVSRQAAEVGWSDRLFVPGVDGDVTLCFTLLSKNGPNHFFLGQGVLRLRDTDSGSWRGGIDLPLADHVQIFPKTTQRQPLRLVEISGAQKAPGSSKRKELSEGGLFANSDSCVALSLSAHVRPFSDAHSYCGYMGVKSTLESAQTSARWCVLADGVLRIYRHLGVTLASDVVDMARALDVRLVDAASRAASGSGGGGALRRQQSCVAIQHVNRLYLLQADHKAGNRVWLKKLQAATKFGAAPAADASSSAPPPASFAHTPHTSTSG